MKRLIIASAFSLNMLPFTPARIYVAETSRENFVRAINKLRIPRLSVIGHKATADVLSQILGWQVNENRINYVAENGDIIAVFIPGIRLEEGKVLTEDELKNFPGRYFFVTIRLEK